MVDATSALAGHMTPGDYGAQGARAVTLSEVSAMSLVHIAGDGNGAAAVLGVELPGNAGGVAVSGGVRALWLGPDTWLVKAPVAEFGEWAGRIATALPNAAVNDVTHGRVTIRLEGPSARDVLAAGCPLDLHERAFAPGHSCSRIDMKCAPGHAAASLLGHFNVLIECLGPEPSPDTFEVTVTRSYGRDLLSWLERAAAEFGYRIV